MTIGLDLKGMKEEQKVQALRFNAGKPELHWLDAWKDAMFEVCKPFMFGAEKYGP